MADHRLTLHRGSPDTPYLLWVMLNPSTADDQVDDPTIRRCRGFTTRLDYNAFRVCNLYTLRATDPRDLWAAPPDERNDERADEVLRTEARHASTVILAWGAHGRRDPSRVAYVLDLLHGEGHRQLWRLGEPTSDGHPRHPLYLAAATPLRAHSQRPPAREVLR